MKKKNNGIRTLVTSAVLLVLVIAGAWTLKARNEAREAQAAAAEAAAEEAAQAEAEAAAQAEKSIFMTHSQKARRMPCLRQACFILTNCRYRN